MHHSLYISDVAPCNYWLFPQLKKSLGGCSFEDRKDVLIISLFLSAQKIFKKPLKNLSKDRTNASLPKDGILKNKKLFLKNKKF